MNKTVKYYLFIILGVVGGYAVTVILSPSTTAIIHHFWPATASADPPALYLYVDLLYSTIYLMVGAYVAAWIAGTLTSSVILGVIFCILGILTMATGADTVHPMWYQWYFIIAVIPATLLGGYLRNRNRETLAPEPAAQG